MEITEEQKRKVEEIAQKYSLELILLFGSQATGKARPESDFDVAFLSEKKLSFEEELQLDVDFMPIFHSDKIDLVNLRNANPLLLHEVVRDARLVYGDEGKFFEFQAYVFKNYIDHQSLFELEGFLVKKRQQLLADSMYAQ